MANEWILDVIEDLRRFADLNEMPKLTEALQMAASVAECELEASRPFVPMGTKPNAGIGGSVSRRLAAGQDA